MTTRILLPLIFVTGSLLAQVTYDRLLHAEHEPQNWLTYSGGYASQRYSQLTQINRDNVKNLSAAIPRPKPGPAIPGNMAAVPYGTAEVTIRKPT
jgi:hypothetical protein